MEAAKKEKSNRRYAYVIGFGVALSAIHNLWLTTVTSINGQATLFLPAIGTAIWVMATLFFVRDNWGELDWGDKKVLVPLIVIVASIGLSGIVFGTTIWNKVAPLFLGVSLLALYIVSRTLGTGILRAFIPFVVIGALISITLELVYPEGHVAGLITNDCAYAGFLIFGSLSNQGKWQWLLCLVALVGLFFVGTLEAVFIIAVLGVTIILRRDFSRRFLVIASVLLGVVATWATLGHIVALYENNHNLDTLFGIMSGRIPINDITLDTLTTGRWTRGLDAMRDIQLFGHGFTLNVDVTTVHNIPLIIVDQIGIFGAAAWTFITLHCLVKTKWKYMWTAIIAMSVFDHYLWNQLLPFWWILVGTSLVSDTKSDLLFRGGHTI